MSTLNETVVYALMGFVIEVDLISTITTNLILRGVFLFLMCESCRVTAGQKIQQKSPARLKFEKYGYFIMDLESIERRAIAEILNPNISTEQVFDLATRYLMEIKNLAKERGQEIPIEQRDFILQNILAISSKETLICVIQDYGVISINRYDEKLGGIGILESLEGKKPRPNTGKMRVSFPKSINPSRLKKIKFNADIVIESIKLDDGKEIKINWQSASLPMDGIGLSSRIIEMIYAMLPAFIGLATI